MSLHSSLSAKKHLDIGRALESLREDGVLILGSGYTFHNLPALFAPSQKSIQASKSFNNWLKEAMLRKTGAEREKAIVDWEQAPGARTAHPREEHLLPLFCVAAAGGDDSTGKLVFEPSTLGKKDHLISGYIFD